MYFEVVASREEDSVFSDGLEGFLRRRPSSCEPGSTVLRSPLEEAAAKARAFTVSASALRSKSFILYS